MLYLGRSVTPRAKVSELPGLRPRALLPKAKTTKIANESIKKVTSITYRTGGRQSLNMRCVFLDDSSLERAGKYRNSQAAAHAERHDPSYASF